MKKTWIFVVLLFISIGFFTSRSTPISAAQICSNGLIEGAVLQVMGRVPNGSGNTGECNPQLYGIVDIIEWVRDSPRWSYEDEVRYRVEYYFGRSQTTTDSEIKKWKNFNPYFFENLDYGLYWYGYGNQAQKYKPGFKNTYYNPLMPTIIYVHGWQKDTSLNQFRETSYSEQANAFIYDKWIEKGWNVGVFYWNQFADDDPSQILFQVTRPEFTQRKIWTPVGDNIGMRWRNLKGEFVTTGAPNKSAAELFYDSYVAAMANHDKGVEIRFAGHSLGSQMAVRMTKLLKDNAKIDLLPDRVALLDAAIIGEGFNQDGPSYLGGRKVVDVIGDYIQDLKEQGVVFEWYKSTNLNELSGNDDTSLKPKVAYARLWPTFDDLNLIIPQKLARYHTHAWDWYFRSFTSQKPGYYPSAKSPYDEIRSFMNQIYNFTQKPEDVNSTERLDNWTSDPGDDLMIYEPDVRSPQFVKVDSNLILNTIEPIKEREDLSVSARLTNNLGWPIPNESVTFTLYKRSGTELFDPVKIDAKTDKDGRVYATFNQLKGWKKTVASGEFRLKVENKAIGYAKATSTSGDFSIQLIPSGYIDGKVKNQFSQNVTGIAVKIMNEQGEVVDSAVTDENGHYSIGRTPIGNYRIVIDHKDYRRAEKPVSVKLEEQSTIDFDIIGIGDIGGTLRDADGLSVQGATLELINDKGIKIAGMTTGTDGKYFFDDVDAGPYTIKGQIKDLLINVDPVEISIGDKQIKNINIPWLLTRFRPLTLDKDMVVIENDDQVKMSGNTLDLNGHSLTIYGDFIQSAGTVNINHGKLNVLGSYRIQTIGSNGAVTNSSGILQMVNAEEVVGGVVVSKADRVFVRDDFVMQGNTSHSNYLTGGVIEIKGNFSQINGYPYNFQVGDKLKVILSGKNEQTVRFDNPEYSSLAELEITNKSTQGVVFATPISVKNMHYAEGINVKAISIMDWTLSQNQVINSDLMLNASWTTIDLNGKQLIINGDFTHTNGKMMLNHGKLIVKGNYLIEGLNSTNSSGVLEMIYGDENPDRLLVEGNFVMHSNTSHINYLTGGVIEIKGNFSQINGYPYNFQVGDKLKVILSGKNEQTVRFDNPEYSRFMELEITNRSAQGVVFATPISVKNMHYAEGINVKAISIMDWTLSQNQVINSDLMLNASWTTIDLNGNQLIINGNFTHTNGKMMLNHGKLIVKGNYLIEGLNGTNSSGVLEMIYGDENPDRLLVEGNFVMHSNTSHINYLTGGVIEIKGNFSQINGYPYNFQVGDKLKVILSGKNEQTVRFDNPEYSSLAELEITNKSTQGVVFATPISVKNMHYAEGINVKAISIMDWTLSQNQVINSDLMLDAYWTTIDLNGKQLIINGDFTHTNGKMMLNHGKLIVKGNYLIERINGTNSSGVLEMVNGDANPDEVLVEGNFVMHSNASHINYLTGGVIEVKGNFSQINGYPYNFQVGDKLKVILSGENEQTVRFENPEYSSLAELEITNKSAQGVVFATPISVKNMHYAEGINVKAISIMDWTLSQNQVINSDLRLDATTIDLNDHQLIINGNLTHSGGKMRINHGKLVVMGDYLIERADRGNSNGILEMVNGDSDEVEVEGNFVMRSSISHVNYLSGGILEVKGNFSQLNGHAYNFHAGSNFKVILSGTKKQMVHFDNPDMNFSRFYILEIRNNQVEFATDYFYVTLIDLRDVRENKPNYPDGHKNRNHDPIIILDPQPGRLLD
ncbi:MSCRAMM family protein [Pseudoneobacillus sp. C159]